MKTMLFLLAFLAIPAALPADDADGFFFVDSGPAGFVHIRELSGEPKYSADTYINCKYITEVALTGQKPPWYIEVRTVGYRKNSPNDKEPNEPIVYHIHAKNADEAETILAKIFHAFEPKNG